MTRNVASLERNREPRVHRGERGEGRRDTCKAESLSLGSRSVVVWGHRGEGRCGLKHRSALARYGRRAKFAVGMGAVALLFRPGAAFADRGVHHGDALGVPCQRADGARPSRP